MKTKRIHTIEDIDLEEMWVDLRDNDRHHVMAGRWRRVDPVKDIAKYIHCHYRVTDDYRKAEDVSKKIARELVDLLLKMGYLVYVLDEFGSTQLCWQI